MSKAIDDSNPRVRLLGVMLVSLGVLWCSLALFARLRLTSSTDATLLTVQFSGGSALAAFLLVGSLAVSSGLLLRTRQGLGWVLAAVFHALSLFVAGWVFFAFFVGAKQASVPGDDPESRVGDLHTYLSVDSDPESIGSLSGGRKLFTLENSRWGAYLRGQGHPQEALWVNIRGVGEATPSVSLMLGAPRGQPLAIGEYRYAGDFPWNDHSRPQLYLGIGSNACGDASGRFTISELAIGPGHRVERLLATFEVYCYGRSRGTRGEISIGPDLVAVNTVPPATGG